MTRRFCTACGHCVAMDARFCENCGVVFETEPVIRAAHATDAGGADVAVGAITRADVVKHARSAVVTWIIPFNATLIFGSTLVAVFDFLSPRIALLPIAASIAVVGLLASLALRKFVAPSLPVTSAFRHALAPDSSLLKSPLLIGTGLLSALMVSGAAWSSANSIEGGIIASKFDGARVAQMQVGLLQGIQKEQRQQTALLEDIREGRAADPRRELSNIGAGFTAYELDAAIDRGDVRTIRLLLSGGFKWRVSNAYVAFASSDPKISTLLLANMANFELRSGDCERLIEERFASKKQWEMIGGAMRPPIDLPGKTASDLKPFEKKMLKTFCSKPEVQKFVGEKLSTEMQKVSSIQRKDLDQDLSRQRSREICVNNKSAQRPSELRLQQRYARYSIGCFNDDCSADSDKLRLAAHDEKKYAQVVQEICVKWYPLVQLDTAEKKIYRYIQDKKGDLPKIYQQILESIS